MIQISQISFEDAIKLGAGICLGWVLMGWVMNLIKRLFK